MRVDSAVMRSGLHDIFVAVCAAPDHNGDRFHHDVLAASCEGVVVATIKRKIMVFNGLFEWRLSKARVGGRSSICSSDET